MLRPNDLAAKDLSVALKPRVGYETQLYLSPEASQELGQMEVVGVSSGIYTASVPENLALAGKPQELLIVVDEAVNDAGGTVVVTITGKDQNDAAFTGTATLRNPSYAKVTTNTFPVGFAAEVIPVTPTQKCKSITSISIACASDATGMKIKVFGVPSITSFSLCGCKTKISFGKKVPKPANIQCGRDQAAFVVKGEIPPGTCSVTTKITNNCTDGLDRFRGLRVTGLLKVLKEDTLAVEHTFVFGLILTPSNDNGESVDADTVSAEGMYEDYAQILPQGP